MHRPRIIVFLLLAGCLVLASASGCGNGFSLVDAGSLLDMPWREKPDTMPGVVPPHQRIAELREIAANGHALEPTEQEALAQRLAAEIAHEADPLIRLEIVRAAAVCNTPEADALLASAVEDDSADVRSTACEMLGRRGGAEAVRLLSKTVASDTNTEVRLAATRALGETGDAAAVAGLGAALEDGDPTLQYRAVLSLKKVTHEDFGQDVGLWRQYVRGENPPRPRPASLAERIRAMF